MTPKPTKRLVIRAPLSTIERLAAEHMLIARGAEVLSLDCTDGTPTATLRAYACAAVSARLAQARYPWPVTPEVALEGLQRIGVKQSRAAELVGQFLGTRDVIPEAEQPNDLAACDGLLALVGSDPYVAIKGCTPAAKPTAPEPEPAAPPEREPNEVTEDGWDTAAWPEPGIAKQKGMI